MPDIQTRGSVQLTADGVVGTSGSPVRVFNMHIVSGGGGAAIVSLYNNTAATGTAYMKETGTVSTGKTFDYGNGGQLFASGCFVDVDTNTASVLISYSV